MEGKDVESKFEDGKVYTITNVFDKKQLALWYKEPQTSCLFGDGSKLGMCAIYAGLNNFSFRAEIDDEQDPPRGHRLVSLVKANAKSCLEMIPKRQNGRCVLKEVSGDDQQFWCMIPCHENNSYHIINALNGKAMCEHGDDNVRCVTLDSDNVHQQWTYTAV